MTDVDHVCVLIWIWSRRLSWSSVGASMTYLWRFVLSWVINFLLFTLCVLVLVWGFSLLSCLVISAVGLVAVAIIPVMHKVIYNHLLQFLVALAIGSLTGDAVLHLLPHVSRTSFIYCYLSTCNQFIFWYKHRKYCSIMLFTVTAVTASIFRSLPGRWPNRSTIGSRRVCPSGRPYVLPSTSSFVDFILIWCVGRPRPDICTSVTSTRSKLLKFRKLHFFLVYLLRHFRMELKTIVW